MTALSPQKIVNPNTFCSDIKDKDISPCFVEQIESLEAKAYIIVPVRTGDRLLGMIGVYQNSGTRNWQQPEVDLVVQSAPKFSSPLEQTSSLRDLRFKAKQAELISDRDFLSSINQNAESMMQGWLDKIRGSMKIDRAAVFAFYPDWSGQILAESKGEKWEPIGSTLDYDFHFKGGEFEPYYVANDVQTKGLSVSVVERFEEIKAKAYIIVPIHSNNQLMGVLAVYQNTTTRNWQESEITQMQEYAYSVRQTPATNCLFSAMRSSKTNKWNEPLSEKKAFLKVWKSCVSPKMSKQYGRLLPIKEEKFLMSIASLSIALTPTIAETLSLIRLLLAGRA